MRHRILILRQANLFRPDGLDHRHQLLLLQYQHLNPLGLVPPDSWHGVPCPKPQQRQASNSLLPKLWEFIRQPRHQPY